MTGFFTSELSAVPSASDKAELLAAIEQIPAEYLQASVAVSYDRKGYENITNVYPKNESYQGSSDEYLLTVQVRVPQYDGSYAILKPFVEASKEGIIEAKRKEAEAEIESLIAERNIINARISQLNSTI